jgi:hypothetical protein
MESLNLINYSTLNIHVPCFCCHEFTLFLCYENLWTFFFLSFCYLMHWLVTKLWSSRIRAPCVRGRAEHLRSTGLGGWCGGVTDLWMNEDIHTCFDLFFLCFFPIESLLKNELKKNGMSFFTFFPFSEAKNSFGASKPCLVKRYMNWWFKW